MDPLSYLAQTEQQLSFIMAGGGRGGGAEGRRFPVGFIKESDIIGGGGGRDERRRVSGVVKVPTDRDTRRPYCQVKKVRWTEV